MKTRVRILGCVSAAATLALVTLPATAQITYVDATTANTTAWDGSSYGVFSPLDPQGAANDGLWDVRAFANGGTIYQNAAYGGNDDAQRLKTTVSGLANGSYDVYAYYWTDGSGWQIEAALTDSVGSADLPNVFSTPGGDVTQWFGGADGTFLSSDPSVNGGVNPFTSEVMVGEGNRRLLQAAVGQANVTDGTLTVFIDDNAAMNGSPRTWYDGIGFAFAVPEPSSLALLGLGMLVGVFRLRRS